MLTKDMQDVVAFIRKRSAKCREWNERRVGDDNAVPRMLLGAEASVLEHVADAIESGEYIGASKEPE